MCSEEWASHSVPYPSVLRHISGFSDHFTKGLLTLTVLSSTSGHEL